MAGATCARRRHWRSVPQCVTVMASDSRWRACTHRMLSPSSVLGAPGGVLAPAALLLGATVGMHTKGRAKWRLLKRAAAGPRGPRHCVVGEVRQGHAPEDLHHRRQHLGLAHPPGVVLVHVPEGRPRLLLVEEAPEVAGLQVVPAPPPAAPRPGERCCMCPHLGRSGSAPAGEPWAGHRREQREASTSTHVIQREGEKEISLAVGHDRKLTQGMTPNAQRSASLMTHVQRMYAFQGSTGKPQRLHCGGLLHPAAEQPATSRGLSKGTPSGAVRG